MRKVNNEKFKILEKLFFKSFFCRDVIWKKYWIIWMLIFATHQKKQNLTIAPKTLDRSQNLRDQDFFMMAIGMVMRNCKQIKQHAACMETSFTESSNIHCPFNSTEKNSWYCLSHIWNNKHSILQESFDTWMTSTWGRWCAYTQQESTQLSVKSDDYSYKTALVPMSATTHVPKDPCNSIQHPS